MGRGNVANLGHYAHPKGGYKSKTGPLGVAKVVPAPSPKLNASIAPGGTGVARPMIGATRPVTAIPLTPPTPKLGLNQPTNPVTSRITAGAPAQGRAKRK